MSWTPGGGGKSPWGGGGNNGHNPWNGGGNNGGGNDNGPDLDAILRKGQERFRKAMPGGFGNGGINKKMIALVAAVLVLGWLATGIYRVQPDQQGVVMVFGKWVDTTTEGLHFNWPAPIGHVLLPTVTKVNQLQLGIRAADPRRGGASESRMLTGDENIVEAEFTVFWRISDAGQFLFNVRNPENTVKLAAESAMRDSIGRNPIQAALSDKRQQIADEARDELQRILDSYGAGITITQVQLQKVEPPAAVIDAFNDVQRARADQERTRNEAEAYRNDILPRARGEAEQMIQGAEAYKEQVVNEAKGEVERFLALHAAWKNSRDVTERRLYMEAMEEVLAGTNKVILDSRGGQGAVPYLPLNELNRMAKPKASPSNNGGQQ